MKTNAIHQDNKPILNNQFINELLTIPKHIPRSAKHPFNGKRYDDGSIRSSISFTSDDYRFNFVISTRVLVSNPSNFSVVFRYIDPKDRDYIIRRYNGNHGRHYHKDTNRYISGPHIHTITERAQGRYRKDETEAVETKKYETLEQAIDFALSDLNIKLEYVALRKNRG